MVRGDETHEDTDPVCIEVKIAQPAPVLCEITFAAGGGTGTMGSVTVEAGTDYTLPACGFTAPDGKDFDKWDLGKVGAKITIQADTAITALWKDVPVKAGATLLAKLLPSGKTALKLTWTKVSGAEGYDIYAITYGSSKYQLKGTVKAGEKLEFTLKGLEKKSPWKAYVKAWKKTGKKKAYLGKASPVVHAIVGGSSDKQTTPKTVTVKKKEVNLQLKKTHTIEATVTGYDSSKEILADGALLRYVSSNVNVARVSSKGVVTARHTGRCVITVFASSGVSAKVTVNVTREAPEQTEVVVSGGLYQLNKEKTYAIFDGVEKKDITKLTIAATVKIGGKSYRVEEIAASAGMGLSKLKSLTVGKYVKKIGKKAFYDCGSLKTILLKTEKLANADAIGAEAFGKSAGKHTVKCPKSMLKKYTKWLKKKGLPKGTVFEEI